MNLIDPESLDRGLFALIDKLKQYEQHILALETALREFIDWYDGPEQDEFVDEHIETLRALLHDSTAEPKHEESGG